MSLIGASPPTNGFGYTRGGLGGGGPRPPTSNGGRIIPGGGSTGGRMPPELTTTPPIVGGLIGGRIPMKLLLPPPLPLANGAVDCPAADCCCYDDYYYIPSTIYNLSIFSPLIEFCKTTTDLFNKKL